MSSIAATSSSRCVSSPANYSVLVLISKQVEGVLFKVARRPFEQESKIFTDLFELPAGDGSGEREGETDSNPIHLEGVTEEEFRSLLWVMFRP